MFVGKRKSANIELRNRALKVHGLKRISCRNHIIRFTLSIRGSRIYYPLTDDKITLSFPRAQVVTVKQELVNSWKTLVEVKSS